jgi:hypothetical protein
MFMMREHRDGVCDVIDFEKATGKVDAVGLRSTRLRDVNRTACYLRNGEVVRVGNKNPRFAQIVLDMPIDAWADIDQAGVAVREVAPQLTTEDGWSSVFLWEPEPVASDRSPARRR